jgi:hypothetical protein
MAQLAPNQVAINKSFKDALQAAGISTSFPERAFTRESGYLLRT